MLPPDIKRETELFKPKAFAIDLDGTLLVGEEIPADNIAAIQRADAAGVHVMIATARWSQIAERIGDQLGIKNLIIACSGAQVRDTARGVDIFDHRLPADFTEALFDICNNTRCVATVTFNTDVRLKLDGEPDRSAMGPEMSWVPQLQAEPDNLPRIAAVQGSQCVQRIRDELEAAYADQVNIFDSIGPTGKIIITITAKAATKGLALHAACDHLNISPTDAVAFGDAENDLEMFRAAGAAVAMGQADDETKQAATWITRPNYEAGVGYAIDQLLTHGEVRG